MTRAAVSDAGPLIHLAEIDSLELLSAFDSLAIPETVYEELQAGGVPEELRVEEYELVEPTERWTHSSQLDDGEIAAMSVAVERNLVFLTDDLAARKTASEEGIDVHGSVGIIALGYSSGMLDKAEAKAKMRALQRETSLFVTDAVVERGIRMLDDT